MQVREIMTTDVLVVPPDLPLRQAAERMRERDVGALPVDDDGRLLGIITDRDIAIRGVARGLDPQTATVADAMTPDILYCYDDQQLEEAAHVMEREQIRRLPIVDRDKRLVGILSLGDIATRGGAPMLTGEVTRKISEPS